MKKMKFEGLMPAIITPMNNQGGIDYEGLKKNIDYLIDAGCTGVIVNGSTGEAVNLNREERVAIIRTVAEVGRGKIKIIAGTGAATTNTSIEYTEDAMKSGADAVLVLTPFNAIPNEEGLYLHYKKIAEVGIPVILYNLPQHTNVEIDLNTMGKLIQISNIVGLKESSGNLSYLAEAIRLYGKDITMISGCDDLILQTLSMGTPSLILALGNIAPHKIIEIFKAIQNNDLSSAKEKYFRLLPIARAISVSVNFPAPVKEAVRLLGRPSGPPRLPVLPVNKEESEDIRKSLEYAGLL